MVEAALFALPVTAPGGAQRVASSYLRADFGAVDPAAITAAADGEMGLTQRADGQSQYAHEHLAHAAIWTTLDDFDIEAAGIIAA
jgi:hypothetical protein